MANHFRKKHLIELLKAYEQNRFPIDHTLRSYFHKHRSIGSKDRKFISENVYQIIRWQGLLDAHLSPPISFETRVNLFLEKPLDQLKSTGLEDHIALSFPNWLYTKLVESLGKPKAVDFCKASNAQAPLTARVNTCKISRDELLERLSKEHCVQPCAHSSVGFTFSKRANFQIVPEYKEGLFEVQDEASQMIAALVRAKPGEHVLDFCAGSGGKSLAIAPSMKGLGALYLHDIREMPLLQARKRLCRAGIQNAEILSPSSPKLHWLEGRCDWVLADVPCSGTGTLRRNPDQKWRLTADDLKKLITLQRQIFEKALSFVKPGGCIVYATCSILPAENDEQINSFCQTFSLNCKEIFHSLPKEGSMDGFFGAVLTKRA